MLCKYNCILKVFLPWALVRPSKPGYFTKKTIGENRQNVTAGRQNVTIGENRQNMTLRLLYN